MPYPPSPLSATTEQWPRIPRRLQHHPDADHEALLGETRLDLADLTHVAEPTQAVPLVTPTDRPPYVKPIPRAAAGRQPYADLGTPTGSTGSTDSAQLIRQVLEQQHELNVAAAQRIRPVGPGGVFGWKPAAPPSLKEVAEARVRATEREEGRRFAHERRMDHLAEARSIVALACLFVAFVLLVAAGYIGFMILSGSFAWTPTSVQ